MTTYTAIPNADVDQDSPVTQPLMTALRDNVLAIQEGDPTAPKIRDAALDTGAATAAGIAWVGLRTAGLAVGAVGSYAMMTFSANTTATQGTTHAASTLRYSNASGANAGNIPSGTWRLMGQTQNASAQASTAIFLRIS